ncbi:MAG: tryptophan--tRNA ligase, partial [Burkholderiaceae bacterium]
PARVRRNDPGDPENCPVWSLHQTYSSSEQRQWVQEGCKSAGIGCLECKQPVIDAILAEQKVFIDRARPYHEDPDLVKGLVADGCEKARELARQTMRDVREAMGLNF